jgi:hypothetical protein
MLIHGSQYGSSFGSSLRVNGLIVKAHSRHARREKATLDRDPSAVQNLEPSGL